ncbi:hypothetical protein DMJ13_21470 [halophilic archaeon]|nr:hypothetical protein DMJ13_21470 [halophilic archaeon]
MFGITLIVIGAFILGFGLIGTVARFIAEQDARLVVLSSLVLIGSGFFGLVMMMIHDEDMKKC